MSSTSDVQRIESMTKRQKNMNPRELAETVTKFADKTQAKEVLLSQVQMAREMRKTGWLASLAKELNAIQFHSSAWISQNVSHLAPVKKTVSKDIPSGPSRDIRIKTDPNLQRTGEHLEHFEGEDKLLSPGEEEGMDLEISPEEAERLIAPSPPRKAISSKPVSPVKPQRRCSSTHEPICAIRPVASVVVDTVRSERLHSASAVRPADRTRYHSSRPSRPVSPRRQSRQLSSSSRRSTAQVSASTVRQRKRQPERLQPGTKQDVPEKRRYRPSSSDSSRARVERCPIVGCGVPIQKKHVLDHLPGVFNTGVKGEDVAHRRIGALKLASRWLLGARSQLHDLVKYADSMGVISEITVVDDDLRVAMEGFCSVLKVSMPDDVTILPSGNGITALLHWKVLIGIVSALEEHQLESLKNQFQLSHEEQQRLPRPPKAFDSHCHLDRTMRDIGIKDPSLSTISSHYPAQDEYEVNLVGVTAVFCDPETYPTLDELHNWISQGVVPVVGLHPKRSITEEEFAVLQKLVASSEVVGLGEVGIDHTEPPSTWVGQMMRLERVLTLLQPNHILVLHCRSSLEVADEAVLTVMYMLMSHPNVRRNQLIHLHCYSGSWQILQRWLEVFPYTYVGFTSVAASFKTSGQLEAVLQLPSERLLLETDAPYFRIGGYRRSTPGLIGMAAAKVASARHVPWKELLQSSTSNAERLYLQLRPPACVEVPSIS